MDKYSYFRIVCVDHSTLLFGFFHLRGWIYSISFAFQAKNFKPSGLVSPKAFLAIGQIAYSMQDGIICYIDKIFTVIKPYIPNPLELAKYVPL